jgi:hypothetical protein
LALRTMFSIKVYSTITIVTDMVIQRSTTALTKIMMLWIYRSTGGADKHIDDSRALRNITSSLRGKR